MFDVDYTQIKFKPKVVISKVGIKPCISTKYTK